MMASDNGGNGDLHPGPLHNLTLHIQVSKRESFYLFSVHQVRLPNQTIPTGKAAYNDTRRSQTPSPQKIQRMKYAQLDHWYVRICQTIDQSQSIDEESSTEDEGEKSSKNKKVKEEEVPGQSVIAWYSIQYKVDNISSILEQQQQPRKKWEEVETQLRSSWEAGSVDILGSEEVQNEDGTYEEIRLQFDLKADTSKGFKSDHPVKRERIDEEPNRPVIQIDLKRIKDEKDVIQQSSMVAVELMKALGTLKTKAQSLERERNSSRKLIHDNRKHERYHEPSASLINPGRIKRKLQDDSGFEGEED